MINTLIVEDNPYVRKAFLNPLDILSFNINKTRECESFRKPSTVANISKPDLAFLDINSPIGNSFDSLEQPKHLNFKLVFITEHEEEYAFKKEALDYLLKSIDIDNLKEALEKVTKTPIAVQKEQVKKVITENFNKIILSLQDSLQVISLNELMFCKSDKGYTSFFLENGKTYMASKPIKEFEEQLSKTSFTRPHQSYMVNLNFIDKYDKSGTIYLKNKQKIPVSSRKKEDFLSNLFNWHDKK